MIINAPRRVSFIVSKHYASSDRSKHRYRSRRWHPSSNRKIHHVKPKLKYSIEWMTCKEKVTATNYLAIFMIAIVETIEKMAQDLIFTPFTAQVFWMFLRIVDTSQIFDGDHAIMVPRITTNSSLSLEHNTFHSPYLSSLAKAFEIKSRRNWLTGG